MANCNAISTLLVALLVLQSTVRAQAGCCLRHPDRQSSACEDQTEPVCQTLGGTYGCTDVGSTTSFGDCGFALGAAPSITAFDGQQMEFQGQVGRNYSLLTAASLVLNVRLVSAGSHHIQKQVGQGELA